MSDDKTPALAFRADGFSENDAPLRASLEESVSRMVKAMEPLLLNVPSRLGFGALKWQAHLRKEGESLSVELTVPKNDAPVSIAALVAGYTKGVRDAAGSKPSLEFAQRREEGLDYLVTSTLRFENAAAAARFFNATAHSREEKLDFGASLSVA